MWKKWLFATGLSVGLLPTVSAFGAQARSSAITKWSGECSGGERGYWDDMCMAWRKKLGSKGWSQWWANYELATVSRYVDPSISAWGYDNSGNGFDAGTAALMCLHGGYNVTPGGGDLCRRKIKMSVGLTLIR
jgi:hypothetical protein